MTDSMSDYLFVLNIELAFYLLIPLLLLTFSQTSPDFYVSAVQVFLKHYGRKFSKWVENTAGKGEIAHNKQLLLFSQCFLPSECKSFEKTVGKQETACNKQFLLFPQGFLPIWRTFCHFYLSNLKLSLTNSFSLGV